MAAILSSYSMMKLDEGLLMTILLRFLAYHGIPYRPGALGHVSGTLLDIMGKHLGLRDRCDGGCISCPCPCNIDEVKMLKGTPPDERRSVK
jgi:hypothetical protein